MMFIIASLFFGFAAAKKAGPSAGEHCPKLGVTLTCTKAGGCPEAAPQGIVIDSRFKGIYVKNPEPTSVTVGLGTQEAYGTYAGGRAYLLQDDKAYNLFQLKNKEFAFDVDISNLPCGFNAALYFVQMDADGGQPQCPKNECGAGFGTGYCDAQRPGDVRWSNGEPSSTMGPKASIGRCGICGEMDIWEANKLATQYSQHSCVFGAGPNLKVDPAKKITVVTQFVTSDSKDEGKLTEIKRFYIQDGTQTETLSLKIGEGSCKEWANFRGGLSSMDDEMSKGMVLVMSIWDDHEADMLWLDSSLAADGNKFGSSRGRCAMASGVPQVVEKKSAEASVTFSNIRFGEIDSTIKSSKRRLGASDEFVDARGVNSNDEEMVMESESAGDAKKDSKGGAVLI